MIPTFVAAGSYSKSTGGPTPAIPSGLLAGDLMLMICETAAQDLPATPSGYTPLPGSPVSVGAAGATDATQLSIFYRRYENGLAGVTTGDPGSHITAAVLGFRGCASSGDPVHVYAAGTAAASTAVSIGGVTTTIDDCLVVSVCSRSTDLDGASFSSWSNGTLSDLAEVADDGTSLSEGGGFAVATGGLATAGASGTTTATLSASAVQAFLTFALPPAEEPFLAGVTILVGRTLPLTVPWPAGHQAGDIGLLLIQTLNEAVTVSAGWTELADSPQGTGSGAGATRLTAFWARATSGAESNVSVADSGDHQFSRMLLVRGGTATDSPFDATWGGVKASASTSSSMTGVTTSVDHCLVIYAAARSEDNALAQYSAWANASLDDGLIYEVNDLGSTSGLGGGLAEALGTLATAGASGTTTATIGLTATEGYITMSLPKSGGAPPASVARAWGYIIG